MQLTPALSRLNLILTKNAAPSQKVLGTVFGLSSVAGCLARIVSPTLVRYLSFMFLPSFPTNVLSQFPLCFLSRAARYGWKFRMVRYDCYLHSGLIRLMASQRIGCDRKWC